MSAPNLAALQAALQRDIVGRTGEALERLKVPESASPEKRLFVYQNAYVQRLVGIMMKDYDTTWTFLGDQMFFDLAQEFVTKYPSNTPNARWFSHRFPDFLGEGDLGRDTPAVAEVARVERALGDAFDAANDPVFSREQLGVVAQQGLETAKLILHPSVTLLRLETNAYDIFKALRAEEMPPEIKAESEPRWALVWRRDLVCRHMELDAEQGALLDLAGQGHGVTALCEFAATLGDPETAAVRMAGYLGQWIDNEILTGMA